MVDVSWSKLIKRFEVDLRTLAIFRIIAGMMVIVDVILRYRSLNFFYTDKGAVPLEHLLPHIPIRRFSIHTVSGDPIFIFILGIISII